MKLHLIDSAFSTSCNTEKTLNDTHFFFPLSEMQGSHLVFAVIIFYHLKLLHERIDVVILLVLNSALWSSNYVKFMNLTLVTVWSGNPKINKNYTVMF